MKPITFEINQFGKEGSGVLSVANLKKDIPFEVKRIVWIHGVDDSNELGNHANKETSQVFFAIKNTLTITLMDVDGVSSVYVLENPNQGLIVPPNYWRTLVFSSDSILLVLNSHDYNEDDYVRGKDEFLVIR